MPVFIALSGLPSTFQIVNVATLPVDTGTSLLYRRMSHLTELLNSIVTVIIGFFQFLLSVAIFLFSLFAPGQTFFAEYGGQFQQDTPYVYSDTGDCDVILHKKSYEDAYTFKTNKQWAFEQKWDETHGSSKDNIDVIEHLDAIRFTLDEEDHSTYPNNSCGNGSLCKTSEIVYRLNGTTSTGQLLPVRYSIFPSTGYFYREFKDGAYQQKNLCFKPAIDQ